MFPVTMLRSSDYLILSDVLITTVSIRTEVGEVQRSKIVDEVSEDRLLAKSAGEVSWRS